MNVRKIALFIFKYKEKVWRKTPLEVSIVDCSHSDTQAPKLIRV